MNKSIAKPWLSLQCQMIPGVRHAVFAADKQIDGTFTTLENWPEGADLPATVRAALDAAIASEGVDVRKSDSDHLAENLDDGQRRLGGAGYAKRQAPQLSPRQHS